MLKIILKLFFSPEAVVIWVSNGIINFFHECIVKYYHVHYWFQVQGIFTVDIAVVFAVAFIVWKLRCKINNRKI